MGTAAFMAVALACPSVRSFNWSIEFTGGTMIQVEAAGPD
jgi:preprotein translocase subunit SecF